ncbi:MAG: TlpA family protein disulfide reductase [Williamsia sp.]|nr:TlpA family protein disulfide reductase [Williamsia sp.]
MIHANLTKAGIFLCKSCLIAISILVVRSSSALAKEPLFTDSLQQVRAAVEGNMESMEAHEAFIKAVGKNEALLIRQYDAWIRKNPSSTVLPLAIGTALYQKESPLAKPYLLKAVAIDPKLAKGWFMLSIDASRWGDEEAAMKYMGKASETDPADAGYAFYYAMDFEPLDGAVWRTKLYELAKRFPAHERGAQGLYWLATRSQDSAEKRTVYELLRRSYPPEKFSWSSSGMSGLYDVYLKDAPEKAAALAREMGTEDGWPDNAVLAEKVVKLRSLLAENKGSEARELVKSIKLPRYSTAIDMMQILKSAVYFAAGDKEGAYDSLVKIYAKTPSVELNKALNSYAVQLNKSAGQVEEDVWKKREAAAYTAPAFELDQYLVKGKASLEDFKGKVVLLTFWFPGCGPCRGEFPHFENVLKNYDKNKVAYIGINVVPEQDAYVLPFMKGTKYTFIPLRATDQWAMQTYKVRGEPTNFLIDQHGKVVFANFRIDGSNEPTLALMLNSTLERK